MQNTKLVSIVLPVFNGEKYLATSIESCLNQSHSNIELIILVVLSLGILAYVLGKFNAKLIVGNAINYNYQTVNLCQWLCSHLRTTKPRLLLHARQGCLPS